MHHHSLLTVLAILSRNMLLGLQRGKIKRPDITNKRPDVNIYLKEGICGTSSRGTPVFREVPFFCVFFCCVAEPFFRPF